KEFPCPLCGSPMEFKLGRGGIFMSCKRYPECKGARLEDGTELKDDAPIGHHPDTGAHIFIRTGRFGPYVEMILAEDAAPPDEKPKKGPDSAKASPGKKGRPKKAGKRA